MPQFTEQDDRGRVFRLPFLVFEGAHKTAVDNDDASPNFAVEQMQQPLCSCKLKRQGSIVVLMRISTSFQRRAFTRIFLRTDAIIRWNISNERSDARAGKYYRTRR